MANGRKTDMERVKMEARREQVFNMRRNGASFREIARALNTTEATTHRDYTAVMQRVIENNNDSADAHRQLELTRLDALLVRLHPLVMPSPEKSGEPVPPPNLKAVDRYLRVLDMRVKLLGLNAPERVDATVRHIDMDAVTADLRRRVDAGEMTREELLYVTNGNTSLADELFRGAAHRVHTGGSGDKE